MVGSHGGFAAPFDPSSTLGLQGETPMTAGGDANKGVIMGSTDAPTGDMASLFLCSSATSPLLNTTNGKPQEKPVITGILRGPGAVVGGVGGLATAVRKNAGKPKPRVVGGMDENGDLENEVGIINKFIRLQHVFPACFICTFFSDRF
jgi:hypothetical protein